MSEQRMSLLMDCSSAVVVLQLIGEYTGYEATPNLTL